MKFGLLVGWGIVIYAIMRLAWDGLVIYGFSQGLVPRLVELLILVIVCTIAGRSLRFIRWTDILPYSIFWAFTAAVLDATYSVPFSGWAMYADWNIWIGYSLVALLPLFAPQTRSKPMPSES